MNNAPNSRSCFLVSQLLLPSAPPKWVAKKANHGQGPKYDEQGFGVTCGDELLVFSLDRFAGMSWLNG